MQRACARRRRRRRLSAMERRTATPAGARAAAIRRRRRPPRPRSRSRPTASAGCWSMRRPICASRSRPTPALQPRGRPALQRRSRPCSDQWRCRRDRRPAAPARGHALRALCASARAGDARRATRSSRCVDREIVPRRALTLEPSRDVDRCRGRAARARVAAFAAPGKLPLYLEGEAGGARYRRARRRHARPGGHGRGDGRLVYLANCAALTDAVCASGSRAPICCSWTARCGATTR